MTDLDYDGRTPLDNARHERFSQNIVKGMAAGPAYTAAGYRVTGNSAKSAGGRLLTNVDVQARIAWLQGSTADQIIDIRDAARRHTRAAVETLVSVMGNADAPAAARIAAANGILDRGWGKATQYVQEGENPYDALSLTERQALLAALDALDATEASDDGENATRH